MGINSPQELLELLQQSRLLSSEQLDDVHDSMLLTDDVTKLLDMLVERDVLTEWQKTQLLAGRTGFFIGNYVLLGLLGRGGMGSVFLGRHTTMNRRCAVKVVSKQVGKDPDSLEQFLTEARAIASLDHPNIVQAYDVDKENDHFYIVMEYVEGQSLEEIVDHEGVLDCESAVDCVRQAAEGLAHAHGRNMVHCDIKPSNLLVNEQGIVKILDMGMARLVGESGVSDSDSRSNDRILGTVDYMAPEQAVSAPSFDYRADIYSLGCTLFALLVGHPPFNEGNLTQRILKHQTQTPPSLRRFRQDVPIDLAEICLKMMAKDPNDRYQSTRELADVLAKWTMPDEPIASQQIDSVPPPLPGSDSLVDEALGGIDATAGPAIGTKKKKRSLWEDERLLLPLLVGVIVIVVGVLLFLVIYSARRNDPSSPPDGPDPVVTTTTDPYELSSNDSFPSGNTPDPSQKGSGLGSLTTETDPKTKPTASDFGQRDPDPKVKVTITKRPKNGKKKPPTTAHKTEPKRPNPFTGLPRSVDLPQRVINKASNTIRPLPLGNLLLGTDGKGVKSVKLALVGGDVVLDQHTFKIAKVSTQGLPKWIVQLPWNHTQINVAEIWIEKDNNLMFRWMNIDQDIPAGYLGACILQITADRYKHWMQLSTPIEIEPQKLIPIQNTIIYKVKPRILPDTKALRLKLLKYTGPYRKITYKPSSVLKANSKTTATLTGNGLPPLKITFEYYVKGRATQLRATCFYNPKETRKLRQVNISWKSGKQFYIVLKDLEKQSIIISSSPYANNKEQQAKLNRIGKEIEQLKKLGEILAGLNVLEHSSELPEGYEGLGTIRFEEYIEAGKHKIKLFKTK